MTLLVLAILFLAGLFGGFIDAIAGGGGLITVPALLAVGLPPAVALGTNKFQSSFGTALAVARYARAGLLRTSCLGLAVVASFLASVAGALMLTRTDPELLRRIIPWLLAAVAVHTALNRHFGLRQTRARLDPLRFALFFGLGLGFYDGMFGPGTGSFWTVALVTLLGLELRDATGYTKAVNLASNLGALGFFLWHGAVHFPAGAVMVAGQLLGARLGSGLVVRRGSAFIRPIFLAVVFALTLRLLWQAWAG